MLPRCRGRGERKRGGRNGKRKWALVLGLFGPAEGRKKMGQEGEELGRRVDRV
jgi:hypothetical protein